MPCRSGYEDDPASFYGPALANKDAEIRRLKDQVSFAESALCETLRALEHVDSLVETVGPKTGDWYDWINFKEAGITKQELVKWHKRHKEIDAKYREQERLKKVREDALAKLSAEERKVLGIKS